MLHYLRIRKIWTVSDVQDFSNTTHDYQIQNDQHPAFSSIQTENVDFLHEIGVYLS
jgi:hypothetical protein